MMATLCAFVWPGAREGFAEISRVSHGEDG